MANRFRSLRELTLVRYREFLREPEAVFWTFGFPLFLAIGLGIAFRHRPPEVLRVAVEGDSAAVGFRGSGTARAVQSLRADSGLSVTVMDSTTASDALRSGKIALVARVSGAPAMVPAVTPDTVRVAGAASQIRMKIEYDVGRPGPPASPATAGSTTATAVVPSTTYEYDATRPEGQRARLLVNDALQRGAGRTDPVRVAERRVTEVGSRYIDFFIPGLLGMNLMGSGIWGIAFGVVTARNKKLLKRLAATPMSRFEFFLSYVLSRLTFLVIEVVVLVGFGRLVFGVPMRGPFMVLGLIALVGALAFSGLGLLIASRVSTIEGVSGLSNLAMVPMWIMSGVFFSSANFPAMAQPFIKALPLTAANDALRANMLQGAGLAEVLPQLAVLVTWMLVTMAVALRIFKWR